MRRKLVILNTDQFGYNPASYYYCKYLRDKFEITYVGWNHGQKMIAMPAITIKHIDRNGGPLRIIRMIRTVLSLTTSTDTIILTKPFFLISALMRLLRLRNPVVLDIRTGAVNHNKFKRFGLDIFMLIETLLYRDITVISASLAKKLLLSKRSTILPLGADVLSDRPKDFNMLKLLYVGTLTNRNIGNAVLGFIKFFQKYPRENALEFTIIGAGWGNELERLKTIVHTNDMDCAIHILGSIPHDQLKPYFDSHNIGVSYIPMTKYFDVQPATKTFEYLLSGMVVLATATSENKLVINETNGITTTDSYEEFYRGLVEIYNRRKIYKSGEIRHNARQYSWETIVSNLEKYLLEISAIAPAIKQSRQFQSKK